MGEHNTSRAVSGDRARRVLAAGLLSRTPALSDDALTRVTALLAWRLFAVHALTTRGIKPAVALDADLHDADGAAGTNLRIRDVMERCRQALPGILDEALPSGYTEFGALRLCAGSLRAAVEALQEPPGEPGPGRFYEGILGRGLHRDGTTLRVVRCRGVVRNRGAFYTPAPVVDAILDDALRTPTANSAPVRILDPCCGAGAFLIPALTRLLGRGKAARPRDRGAVRILRDSIFGVDIDPLAVEACRLGLALQVLGAQASRRSGVPGVWKELSRVLPHNIRCGDALQDLGEGAGDEGRVSRLSKTAREDPAFAPCGYGGQAAGAPVRMEHETWSAGVLAGSSRRRPPVPSLQSAAGHGAPATLPPMLANASFDVVVGNPPYLSSYSRESVRMARERKRYLAQRYRTVSGRINTFALFVERGMSLLRPGGCLGFVLPQTLLTMPSYQRLRDFLLEQRLRKIVLCEPRTFRSATVPVCVVLAEKTPGTRRQSSVEIRRFHPTGQTEVVRRISQDAILRTPQHRINAHLSDEVESVVHAMATAGVPLGDVAWVEDGINPGPFRDRLVSGGGDAGRGSRLRSEATPWQASVPASLRSYAVASDGGETVLKRCLAERGSGNDASPAGLRVWLSSLNPEPRNLNHEPSYVRLIEGRDVSRYSPIAWRGLWFRWDKEWLRQLQEQRPDSLAVLGNQDRFLAPAKIVTRQTSAGIVATLDVDGYHCTNSVHTTRLRDPAGPLALEFVLGVLNSEPMQFYYGHAHREKAGLFPQVKVRNLRSVPIPIITPAAPAVRSCHDRIVQLVREQLALHRELGMARAGQGPERKYQRTEAIDREIDRIVADLYGLAARQVTIIVESVGGIR